MMRFAWWPERLRQSACARDGLLARSTAKAAVAFALLKLLGCTLDKGAGRAGALDSLDAARVVGFGHKLNLLALGQAAKALGVDAGEETTRNGTTRPEISMRGGAQNARPAEQSHTNTQTHTELRSRSRRTLTDGQRLPRHRQRG